MSTPTKKTAKKDSELSVGNRCLLSMMGDFFLVEILAVDKDNVKVTFPGSDYPIAGIPVEIQFHDKEGFRCYSSVCVEGPGAGREGIVLLRPQEGRRVQHRDSCRVPTDLTVQVKDQVHVRRYNAALLNLSAGGAFLTSDAPFDFHTSVEMTLSLPGESTLTLLCQVLHIAEPESEQPHGVRFFGIRFVDPDHYACQSIERYIWRRLNDLYATR